MKFLARELGKVVVKKFSRHDIFPYFLMIKTIIY